MRVRSTINLPVPTSPVRGEFPIERQNLLHVVVIPVKSGCPSCVISR
jgi:hypothetical protein